MTGLVSSVESSTCGTVGGIDLVQPVARLCAMNLLLHGIGSQESEPVEVTDSLAADPSDRFDRKDTWSEENTDGRWRSYDYDELVARDKASLNNFWLRDESLEDSDNLPAPGAIATEIVEDLESALEQMWLIAGDLGESADDPI